jgi:hypothetical protein
MKKECLRRILAVSPHDKMAKEILVWLESHDVQYAKGRDVPFPVREIDKRTRPTATKSLRQLLESVDPLL